MADVKLGVMGKHPGYGDFLQSGVSEHVVEAMNGWLDASLPPLRDQIGEDWGPFWDAGQDLRFWIGRAVLGRSVAGILHPSQDRVGRRYPLLFLVEGADISLPLGEESEQGAWDAMADQLERMEAGQGAAALLTGAKLEIPAEDAATAGLGPTLWAHHPTGDLAALLASAAAPDAERARLTRSYWWAPGVKTKDSNRAATWLSCPGLPAPQALAWLLGGVSGEGEEET